MKSKKSQRVISKPAPKTKRQNPAPLFSQFAVKTPKPAIMPSDQFTQTAPVLLKRILTLSLSNLIKYKNKVKDNANDEVVFRKGNTTFSFSPFLVMQGMEVFAVMFFLFFSVIGFLPSKYSKLVIKDASVIQMPTIIGNTIKWSVIVKKDDIKQGQYLVKIPKNAKNITVKSINQSQLRQVLAFARVRPQSQVALRARANFLAIQKGNGQTN